MKHKITLLVLLFISTFGFAQTNIFIQNGAWEVPANWNLGQVPTAGHNVVISGGLTCTLNTPGAVALSMTINGGGTLNIVPTGTLTITNNLFNNGGGLIIDSDASNSGSVIVGSYTGAIASYQRYLTGGDWHLISTPLSSGGGTIASFITAHGASMTQSGVKYSLATYDNAFPANGVSTWKNYTTDGSNPAPATAFVEAKGYEILMNGNGKVGFTGLINDGPIGFNLPETVT